MGDSYKICSRCIYGASIPGIQFDKKGVCNFCKIHDILNEAYPLNSRGLENLNNLVKRIKEEGKNADYDCVVGVSGGRDSTYLLHKTVKLGLRPLAVHYDCGWNSEIAVTNIKNAVSKLNIDLYTVVEDWEEFKDLQISFLKASVPDADIPTDIGLKAALYKTADEKGIKTIITGHSFRTEGMCPLGWTYMDGRYIESVQKKFGRTPLKNFHNLLLSDLLYYIFIKGIKTVYMLPYFEYKPDEVQRLLETELGWEYYGGHHHDNYYTRFFQSYYLTKKFNIDKRQIELSALVRSGQMTRKDALEEMSGTNYPYSQDIVDYVCNKLGLEKKEFEEILLADPKSFHDYSTYYPLIRICEIPIKIACKLNLLPQHIYLKLFLS